METKIYKMSSENIDMQIIKELGELLRNGETVIFPTETVYGLGANALDETAASKIYEAKGRPNDNPLIVHISNKEDIFDLVLEVPEKAKIIINKFWPGPITMILKKKSIIPKRTSGGLDTVAIRMPSNKIANAIINEAGVPIAAPSANISGRPSPTKSEHVVKEMNGRVSAILCAEDCDFGVESTVIDMTSDIPTILRPGSITKEALEREIGEVFIDSAIDREQKDVNIKAIAPGMKYKHYSPNADVFVVGGTEKNVVERINQLIALNTSEGFVSGVICRNKNISKYDGKVIGLGDTLEEVAKNLFDSLIQMDKKKVDRIYSEKFPTDGVGRAIMNRLLKSAGYKVIDANNKYDILFVCTGNTCRSPLAEVLLKDIIRKNGKNPYRYFVHSAGISTIDGNEASKNSFEVAKSNGLDLSKHKSSQLTKEMIDKADVIITMTYAHKRILIHSLPECMDKVFTLGELANEPNENEQNFNTNTRTLSEKNESLSEKNIGLSEKNISLSEKNESLSEKNIGLYDKNNSYDKKSINIDIKDPFGGDISDYEETFNQVKDLLEKFVNKL
ncbi:MAG: threonylcarbamoyl-AMP synthase [Clostridioides sp.]|jgi:L-threonylcarbamoyladenylate synthase|nr:threonylcarbamoyl-AMP synthase [Clostridioides sp.]